MKVDTLMMTLENLLVNKYVRSKTLALNGIIKQGLLKGNFDWQRAQPPKEVQSYVLELLLQVVFIHNELLTMRMNTDDIDGIMEDIVDRMALTLEDSIKEIESFNANGALQALIEMDFIRSKLMNYSKDESEAAFEGIQRHLERTSNQNFYEPAWRHKRTQLGESCTRNTSLMFQCFKPSDEIMVPSSPYRVLGNEVQ